MTRTVYTQSIPFCWRVYGAPTEILEQAVLLCMEADHHRGKIQKAAFYKASIILAVTAADAELASAVESFTLSAKYGGRINSTPQLRARIRKDMDEELREAFGRRKRRGTSGAMEYWSEKWLDRNVFNFSQGDLQIFRSEIELYRNSVVHNRIDESTLLRDYTCKDGARRAITTCLHVMIQIDSAFSHHKPAIVDWWRRICLPLQKNAQ